MTRSKIFENFHENWVTNLLKSVLILFWTKIFRACGTIFFVKLIKFIDFSWSPRSDENFRTGKNRKNTLLFARSARPFRAHSPRASELITEIGMWFRGRITIHFVKWVQCAAQRALYTIFQPRPSPCSLLGTVLLLPCGVKFLAGLALGGSLG